MKHINYEDIAKCLENRGNSPEIEEHLSNCEDCLNLAAIIAKESSTEPPGQLISSTMAKIPRRFNVIPIAAAIAASLLVTFISFEILKPKDQPKDTSNIGAHKINDDKKESTPDFLVLLKTYDELLTGLKTTPFGANPPNGHVTPKSPGINDSSVAKKIRDIEQKLGFKTIVPKFNHGYVLKDARQIENKLVLIYLKEPNSLLLAFEEKATSNDTRPISSGENYSVYFVKSSTLVTLTSKNLQNQDLVKLANTF